MCSAKVMFDPITKQSQGFGYVNFYSKEDAERCIRELNNANFGNKQIQLNWKKSKTDFDSKANIIVRNLPKEVDQQTLYGEFSDFGKIVSCKLEVFQSGESRGFGYVQFENEEQANNAIEKKNGVEIQGKKIEVLKHSKKAERGDNI